MGASLLLLAVFFGMVMFWRIKIGDRKVDLHTVLVEYLVAKTDQAKRQ